MNQNVVQYLQEIRKLIEEKKYHQAKQLIKEAQEIEPENDSLYIEEGLVYSRLGNSKLASQLYSKAISLNKKQSRWVFQTLSVFTDNDYLISKKQIANNCYHLGYIREAVENYVQYIINLSFTNKKPESQVLNNLILGIIYLIKNEQENTLSFNLGDFVKKYLMNKEHSLSFYSVDEHIFLWLGETRFFYQLPKNHLFNEQIFNKIKKNQVKIFYSLNINHPDSQIYETNKFINRIPKIIMEFLKLDQCCLILDSSNERHKFSRQYINSIYKISDSLNVNISRIFHLTQNLKFSKNFENWYLEENTKSSKLNVVYFNGAIIDFANKYANVKNLSPVFSTEREEDIKDKKFLCLNNIPRPHRVYVLYWLIENNLLKDGLVSFNHRLDQENLTLHKIFQKPNYLSNFFPTYNSQELSNLYNKINSYLPIYLDLQERSSLTNDGRGEYVREINEYLYKKTYFSIITESDFDYEGTLGFTEKILKPLVSFHPFIVIGESGILQLLKDLGFQTFSDFIDESYDQENDGLTRINMALNEVNKLCQYSYPELDSWYQEITPILQYNYNHFTQNIIPNSLEYFKNQVLKLGDK